MIQTTHLEEIVVFISGMEHQQSTKNPESSKAEKASLKNLGTGLNGNATGPVVRTWRNKSWDLNVRAVGDTIRELAHPESGRVTRQELYQRIEALLSIDSSDMIVAATVFGGTGANREWNLVGAFWG